MDDHGLLDLLNTKGKNVVKTSDRAFYLFAKFTMSVKIITSSVIMSVLTFVKKKKNSQ